MSHGGLDNFLMTTSNVFFTDDMESLVLNYNSFVGLSFVLGDNNVTIARNEFLEIYPYLDSKIFKREQKQRINSDIKIRCFAINCLALIMKEDIELLKKVKDTQIKRNSEDAKKVAQVGEEFRKYLETPNHKSQIKKVEKHFNMENIYDLLTRILVDEQKLNWNEVIEVFGTLEPPSNSEELDAMFDVYHEEMWER